MEKFTIQGLLQDFKGWLDAYGTAKQEGYHTHTYQWRNLSGQQVLDHMIGDHADSVGGFVQFFVEQDRDDIEVLHITAKAWNGANPPTPEMIAYFNALMVAIHERWRQIPQKPSKGAPIREWSKYRYQAKKMGIRPPTHKQVAQENNYNHTSVRNDYSIYLAEIGENDDEENM